MRVELWSLGQGYLPYGLACTVNSKYVDDESIVIDPRGSILDSDRSDGTVSLKLLPEHRDQVVIVERQAIQATAVEISCAEAFSHDCEIEAYRDLIVVRYSNWKHSTFNYFRKRHQLMRYNAGFIVGGNVYFVQSVHTVDQLFDNWPTIEKGGIYA